MKFLIFTVLMSLGMTCLAQASDIVDTRPDGSTVYVTYASGRVNSGSPATDGTTVNVSGDIAFTFLYNSLTSPTLLAPKSSDFDMRFGTSLANSVVVPTSNTAFNVLPIPLTISTPLNSNSTYVFDVFANVQTSGYTSGVYSFFLTTTSWTNGLGETLVENPQYQSPGIAVVGSTPEPASISLLVIGAIGLLARRRRHV